MKSFSVVAAAASVVVVLAPSASSPAAAAVASAPSVPALVTSVWVPTWPTVHQGDVNLSRVRTVQYLVRANRSPRFAIVADGIYGLATAKAVRSLQAAWGLPVTGVVAAATWNRLIGTVHVGDRGERVRAVQALVNIYGRTHAGYRLVTDGVFGSRTRAAIIRFQSTVDITNIGVVNATTWHYLVWAANRIEAAD